MTFEAAAQLNVLAARLRELASEAEVPGIADAMTALEASARRFEKSWSGSNLGYHARVYHGNFTPPPPGDNFNPEWGFLPTMFTTRGDWREHAFDDVVQLVRSEAGTPDIEAAQAWGEGARSALQDAQSEVLSILSTLPAPQPDEFISAVKEQAEAVKAPTEGEIARSVIPRGQVMTRDSQAATGGWAIAPHQAVLAEVLAVRAVAEACRELGAYSERAAAHLERLARTPVTAAGGGLVPAKVFIGHGRSLLWRELKDFLQDRLHLPWDEFNREPVAGIGNVARLAQLLNECGIAFLIMTAEDETADGDMHARQNVVHEAGLFQGKLGFERAIVMLEEGCTEFSNIAGLGQIRFPVGNISASFEEVRRVLEREGFVEMQTPSR